MKYIISKQQLLQKYRGIKHSLNEKTRRLWCASEANAIGKHGVAMVSAVTQVSRPTIYAGILIIGDTKRAKKLVTRILRA